MISYLRADIFQFLFYSFSIVSHKPSPSFRNNRPSSYAVIQSTILPPRSCFVSNSVADNKSCGRCSGCGCGWCNVRRRVSRRTTITTASVHVACFCWKLFNKLQSKVFGEITHISKGGTGGRIAQNYDKRGEV